MDAASIIELIAQQGGALGLAIFAILMLNKVWEARLSEEKRHGQLETQMRLEVQEALNRNTEVLTTLCERFRYQEDT